MNAATSRVDAISLFEPNILTRAASDAVVKLNPLQLVRNPVIFTTEVVAVLTTFLGMRNLLIGEPAGFAIAIAVWLWLTVLFATFAEAVAEGRGRPARNRSAGRAPTPWPSCCCGRMTARCSSPRRPPSCRWGRRAGRSG